MRLRITLEDRQGILADITTAISNRNTNIRESRSTTDLGSQRGKVEFTVDVADVKHLQKVMQSLRAVAGVRGVERA